MEDPFRDIKSYRKWIEVMDRKVKNKQAILYLFDILLELNNSNFHLCEMDKDSSYISAYVDKIYSFLDMKVACGVRLQETEV
jgi:hypothetical protein